MLALNETTKTFEIILGAVPATEGEWITSYLEGAMDSGVPSTFDAKIDSGVSNGTTAVTVLSAPPANSRRVLKSFSYYSVVASTFTFRLNPGGGVFRRVVFILDAGDVVTYEDSEGWNVLDSTGGQKTDTGVSFPLLAPNGLYAAPSYSFSSFTESGILIDPAVTAGNPGLVINSPDGEASRVVLTDKFVSLGIGTVAAGVTPTDSTFAGPSARAGDANLNGSHVNILPGISTGTGFGRIRLYTSLNAASGSTQNAQAVVLEVGHTAFILGNVTILSGGSTPTPCVVRGYNAAGSNVVGSDLNLSSGAGTGIATRSTVSFSTPDLAASGATPQTLVTRMSLVGPSLALERTVTAAGTTGAQTIDKMAGSVNFAAGATTLVVTNALVGTSSIVICVVLTNDTTAIIKNCVPGAGSFTITLTAAATAETRVGFWVLN